MTGTIAKFQSMLVDLESQEHILAQERGNLAYDSLMGEKKATARLVTIGEELLTLDHQKAIATAALAEAHRRHQLELDAEYEAAVSAAEGQLHVLKELFDKVDECLEEVFDLITHEIMPRMHQTHEVGLTPT
jgi:hypothetical protein